MKKPHLIENVYGKFCLCSREGFPKSDAKVLKLNKKFEKFYCIILRTPLVNLDCPLDWAERCRGD
jgi:hypothetical protein